MPVLETAPELKLSVEEISNLTEQLQEYCAIYNPLFRRSEQREYAGDYVHGLLLDLPRKSVEPMVLTLYGADGKDPEFLDAIDALGWWYLADVLPQTQVWCTRPLVQVPAYSGRGQPPKRQRLAPGEACAQTISDIVANLQPHDWSTHVIKEGAKGPMVAEFAAMRVINRPHKLPDAEVWLLVRRHPHTGELKLYLSNAPAQTTLETLVRISGKRKAD